MAIRTKTTKRRTRGKGLRRGSLTARTASPEKAHALRHELDKMSGTFSRREGSVVHTTASRHQLAAAKRRAAKRKAHHKRTR
jgi:hypothetical protein